MISRRGFLKNSAILSAAALLPYPGRTYAGNPPQLVASQIRKRLISGAQYDEATLWGFNKSVPGPELRFKKGDTLSIDFLNKLNEGSSIHWHGIHNINAMDGVAGLTQPEVQPSRNFRYEFPLNDSGTYWYHSHAKTWSQVARGLYGPLIVEDDLDPPVDHDLVLMIDDWFLANNGAIDEASLGSLHDWTHGGRLGNWMTVNGESHPTIDVSDNSRVRLRFINAANARIFALNIPLDNAVILSEDGHLRPIQKTQNVVLAPGQRADFLADVGNKRFTISQMLNDTLHPAATINPIQSNHRRVEKSILHQFPMDSPPASIDITIPLHMQGGAMGNLREAIYKGKMVPIRELVQQHNKAWAFNGKVADHHDHLAKINLGQTVSISVRNDTRWNHAIHLHGHHFWIQKQDGSFLDGKRDTYLFEQGEEANLVFIADNPGLWLLHCHMLEHHAAGMAAVIEIS